MHLVADNDDDDHHHNHQLVVTQTSDRYTAVWLDVHSQVTGRYMDIWLLNSHVARYTQKSGCHTTMWLAITDL